MIIRIIIYGIFCVIIGYLLSAIRREFRKEQIKDLLNELDYDIQSKDIISKSATVVLIRSEENKNTEVEDNEVMYGIIAFDNDTGDFFILSAKDICDSQDDSTNKEDTN